MSQHRMRRAPAAPSLGCCSACSQKSQGMGAYQTIMSPGPSSVRYPFHGVEEDGVTSKPALLGWAVFAVVLGVIVFGSE